MPPKPVNPCTVCAVVAGVVAIVVLLAVVAHVVARQNTCSSSAVAVGDATAASPPPPPKLAAATIAADDAELSRFIHEPSVEKVVMFRMPGCGACHMIMPHVDKLVASDTPTKRLMVADLSTAAKTTQELNVRGFPTFISFNGEGKEVDRMVGASQTSLLAFLRAKALAAAAAAPGSSEGGGGGV